MRPRTIMVLSLSCFFAWLLIIPFNGLMGLTLAETKNLQTSVFPLYFLAAHCCSFLLGGLFISPTLSWKKLMPVTGILTVALAAGIWYLDIQYWPLAFITMGFLAAIFILGWSVPFAAFGDTGGRVRNMAQIIIVGNIILVLYNLAAAVIPLKSLYLLSLVPLAAGVMFAFNLTRKDIPQSHTPSLPVKLPVQTVLVFCLVVFILFINGGLMYNVMYSASREYAPFAAYLRNLPYITVMLIFWVWGSDKAWKLSMYLSPALLGIAFVIFALGPGSIEYYLSEAMVHSAFGMLDLFVWVILGYLARAYGSHYRLFGLGLAANTGAILLGDLVGSVLVHKENYRLITGLLAAATVFIVMLLLPWLRNALINLETIPVAGGRIPANIANYLPGITNLTHRERQILKQIFKGNTNKVIASHLNITENTLKTHIKSIYKKLGISHKRELLGISFDDIQSP